ncbi:hypothetical protein T12_13322, partial [Trichinella patagoniensis]
MIKKVWLSLFWTNRDGSSGRVRYIRLRNTSRPY